MWMVSKLEENEYREVLLQKLAQVDAQQKINEEWRDLEYYGGTRFYRDFWDEETSQLLERIDERFGNKIER